MMAGFPTGKSFAGKENEGTCRGFLYPNRVERSL